MYREEAFAPCTPDNAVHLYYGRFWMGAQDLLEIRVAPANTAAPVDFEFRFLIAWTVFYLTGQINVSDVKQLGIDLIIQSLFTAHQLINMVQVDLMEGLPISDQGTDDPVDSRYIIFIRQNTGSGF